MPQSIERICYVDDRTVSTEEAVAKMIGWMRTEQRITHLEITLDGIDRRELVRMSRLPAPLMEFISEERESARLRLCEAVERWFESTKSPASSPNVSEELFRNATEREEDLEYWDEIGNTATSYLKAIDRTLSRKNGPLELDQNAPLRILTSSLRSWAKRQYKIDIDEPAPASEKKVTNHAQLIRLAILQSIKALGYDPTALPVKNTYTSGGVKAEVRHHLVTPGSELFKPQGHTKSDQKKYETDLFNKHWQELRDTDQIVEVP